MNVSPSPTPAPIVANECNQEPTSPSREVDAPRGARLFAVVWASGPDAALWDVMVWADDFMDAARATKWAMGRTREVEVHIVAVVEQDTIR